MSIERETLFGIFRSLFSVVENGWEFPPASTVPDALSKPPMKGSNGDDCIEHLLDELESVDLVPTIFDYLGLEVPSEMGGESFFGCLE